MLKLAILDDYLDCALKLADWSAVRDHAEIRVFREPFASEADAAEQLAGFDILCLMRDRTPFPAALIDALPTLKFATYTGSVNRTFDVAAAQRRAISVSNTTTRNGVNEHSEFIWALIMATARKLHLNDEGMRRGKWQTGFGMALTGKTIGIIGLGNFGKRVAIFARAFGMEVLAWSQNLTPERAEADGATYATFDELMARSDVVTTHLVLSDRTRHLIGARAFALMKNEAVFINTSRGEIVDEEALVAALATGQIAGAGIDVFSQEPLPVDHPLRREPNVLLSPHMGFATRDLLADFYEQTIENVLAWCNGKPIRLVAPD